MTKTTHPPKDDCASCPPKDCCSSDDCGDHQACLISADVGVSALGLQVCVDLCVGGNLPLDVAGLDALPDLGIA
jgi:hypothetical protein